MLGDVKIIDKRSGGWASTWEYFCGNCGASMGRRSGPYPFRSVALRSRRRRHLAAAPDSPPSSLNRSGE